LGYLRYYLENNYDKVKIQPGYFSSGLGSKSTYAKNEMIC